MLKPSHALHIDGLAPSPPFHGNMRRNRIPVPSSAGLTEPSIGAKYVGRTVSISAASACEPPPSISGIVPATNHACAAPALTAGTRDRDQRIAPLPRDAPRHGEIVRTWAGLSSYTRAIFLDGITVPYIHACI